MLMAYGADVNACDAHGKAPVHFAHAASQWQAVKELIDRGATVGVGELEGVPSTKSACAVM
jgi:hypothetical protein